MKRAIYIIMCGAFMLASCCNDFVYGDWGDNNNGGGNGGDKPSGKDSVEVSVLSVAADFSQCPTTKAIPSTYMLSLDGDSVMAVPTATAYEVEGFKSGDHTALGYTVIEGIVVTGTVAMVDTASATNTVKRFHGGYTTFQMPDSGSVSVSIPMREYALRPINITLNVPQDVAEHISSASCTVEGVTVGIDLITGEPIETGVTAGGDFEVGDDEINTTVYIITPVDDDSGDNPGGDEPSGEDEQQTIEVIITYDDGTTETIESDITEIIENIDDNPSSDEPINITGDVTKSTEAGASATIEGWKIADDSIVAK